MSNIEKALELIQTFENGNIQKAEELLDENYIQHNLAYESGRKAFLQSVEALSQVPIKSTVENIRAFEEGDKVFLQSVYDFAGAGKQVAFDIFRFNEQGKIAEHWDNLADLTPLNPSGHSQIDGALEVKDLDQSEKNKEVVKEFLYDVMQGHHPEKIAGYFKGDLYIQHNSTIADGLSGLGAALQALAEQGIEMVYDQTHQILGQGNFVLALSEGSFGSVSTTFYDLWRLEEGKIVEHWDVMEPVLEKEDWKNQNGKF